MIKEGGISKLSVALERKNTLAAWHGPFPVRKEGPVSGPFFRDARPTTTSTIYLKAPSTSKSSLRKMTGPQISVSCSPPSWMLEGHQKWLLTQCLRGRACASPAMHSLRRKDCESIAYQPLSPFSTLLLSTYRLYRSSSQEHGASPPQTRRRLLGRFELGLSRRRIRNAKWEY
jgi:hypothetical protein